MKKRSWSRAALPLLALVFWTSVAGGALWWFGTDPDWMRPNIFTTQLPQGEVLVLESPSAALVKSSSGAWVKSSFYNTFVRRNTSEEWRQLPSLAWRSGVPQMGLSRDSQLLEIGPLRVPYYTFDLVTGHAANVSVLNNVRLPAGLQEFHAQRARHGAFTPVAWQSRRASLWKWRDQEEKELLRQASPVSIN